MSWWASSADDADGRTLGVCSWPADSPNKSLWYDTSTNMAAAGRTARRFEPIRTWEDVTSPGRYHLLPNEGTRPVFFFLFISNETEDDLRRNRELVSVGSDVVQRLHPPRPNWLNVCSFLTMTIDIAVSHWRHQDYIWTHMELCGNEKCKTKLQHVLYMIYDDDMFFFL